MACHSKQAEIGAKRSRPVKASRLRT